jgi:hypothetical protein
MAAECICVCIQFYQGTAFIFRNNANSDLCNGDPVYFLRDKKLIFKYYVNEFQLLNVVLSHNCLER